MSGTSTDECMVVVKVRGGPAWRVDVAEGVVPPETCLDMVVTACLDDCLMYASLVYSSST